MFTKVMQLMEEQFLFVRKVSMIINDLCRLPLDSGLDSRYKRMLMSKHSQVNVATILGRERR